VSIEHADRLQARIEAATQWPPKDEQRTHQRIREWVAFHEADEETLRTTAGWNTERPYLVDPLPEKITGAHTNLIFGEDTTFTAEDEADQPILDALIEENQVPSELQRARDLCGSEGEVWWRIRVDRSVFEYATVEWHSRLNVIPLTVGPRVVACAFVSLIEDEGQAWRYVEIHSDGVQRNLLYSVGSTNTVTGGVGSPVRLDTRPELADLDDERLHDLPMLAGRIVNKLGRDPRVGVSEYQPIRGLLLALNEATSIGAENARLTLKARAVVLESAATTVDQGPDGTGGRKVVPVDKDFLLVTQPAGSEPGLEDPANIFKVLQYRFDADALVTYDGHLTDKICTRASVAPQLVGRHTEQAQSGAALRARLLDSILAAHGKARAWDDALPHIIGLAQRVDALPEEQGGLGRQWADPLGLPAVERASVLPEDVTEETARHVALVGAQIESVETAIRDIHADWSGERVQDELERLARSQPEVFEQGLRTERPVVRLP
jgi:hypothetical protein